MRVRTEKEYVEKINKGSTKRKRKICARLVFLRVRILFTGIPSFPFIFEVRPTQ